MKRTALQLGMVIMLSAALVYSRERMDTGHTTTLKTVKNQVTSNITTHPGTVDQSLDRDEIIIYSDDFEGDADWTSDGGWVLTEDDYNSETHSWNSPNGNENAGASWNLVSPPVTLPDIGDGDVIRFGFHLFADMPDADGDGDNFLEDYYTVSLMDPSELAWHTDGESFWCGQEEVSGYLDSWLQFLDTPPITVPAGGYTLSANMEWGIESPDGAEVSGSCTDGWDAANVRISTDGGDSWDLLVGSDPYDFDYGYGWIWNDAEYDCGGDLEHLAAGWGDQASWHNVTFNLDDYAGEEVIVRFAFGSDPAWSTPDESALTGYRVDDILISNGADDLFSCDASDDCGMLSSGAVWVDQFYDYGVDRPGAFGWEEYLPGYPFNGNVFLDISNFAGSDVIFRFQSRYDDNNDGGVGTGLFIDDFKIYIEAPAGPPPSGLTGVAMDSQCDLSWDDMNVSGTFDYVYDNDAFTNAISLNEGTTFAGSSFEIVGPSTVNSVEIYNFDDNGTVTTTLAGFSSLGAFFDPDPTYTMSVTLDPGWNTVEVAGWDFNNKFIVGKEISDVIAIGLDESAVPSSNSYILFGSWDPWSEIALVNGLPDGEWGIRANVTQSGADATYNVYRDGNSIANGLNVNAYSDFDVLNNETYSYQVSATYPSGDESELSDSIELTPQSSSVYELSHDDGSAEAGVNVGSGSFMAVRFTSTGSNHPVVRAKWYQNSEGGAFYLKIFTDDGGVPGDEVFSTIRTGGVTGWNTYDMSDEGLDVSGDFWVGVKEFSSTRPFGLDTDSDSGNSYYSTDNGSSWNPIGDLGSAGNVMLRVFLDEGEGGGCTLGDANSDGSIDVLDIVLIVNFILNGGDIDSCAADANEDSGIDVLDIVLIVNWILGG